MRRSFLISCAALACAAAGCNLVASFSQSDATRVDTKRDMRAPDLPADTTPITDTKTDTALDFPRADKTNDIPPVTTDGPLGDGPFVALDRGPKDGGTITICQPLAARAQLGTAGTFLALQVDATTGLVYVAGTDGTPRRSIAAAYNGCGPTLAANWGPSVVQTQRVDARATDIVFCSAAPRLCVVGTGSVQSAGQLDAFVARSSVLAGFEPSWSASVSSGPVDGKIAAVGTPTHVLVGWSSGQNIVGRSYLTSSAGFGGSSTISNTPQGGAPRNAFGFERAPAGFLLTYAESGGGAAIQNVPATCELNACSAPPAKLVTLNGAITAMAATSRGDTTVVFGGTGSGLGVARFSSADSAQNVITALASFKPRGARFLDATTVAAVGSTSTGRPIAALIRLPGLTLLRAFAGFSTVTGAFYDAGQIGSTVFFVGEINGRAVIQRCPRGGTNNCP